MRRYLFWSSISKTYFEISRSRALELVDNPAVVTRIRGNDAVFWNKGFGGPS